jgi:hypothetical protein
VLPADIQRANSQSLGAISVNGWRIRPVCGKIMWPVVFQVKSLKLAVYACGSRRGAPEFAPHHFTSPSEGEIQIEDG